MSTRRDLLMALPLLGAGWASVQALIPGSAPGSVASARPSMTVAAVPAGGLGAPIESRDADARARPGGPTVGESDRPSDR